MAKKKQSKKHKFKYATPTVAGQASVVASSQPAVPGSSAVLAKSARSGFHNVVATRDFSYVAVDLRKIGILAVSLVVLELVIWFLFSHTGLGNAIYSSVQVQ